MLEAPQPASALSGPGVYGLPPAWSGVQREKEQKQREAGGPERMPDRDIHRDTDRGLRTPLGLSRKAPWPTAQWSGPPEKAGNGFFPGPAQLSEAEQNPRARGGVETGAQGFRSRDHPGRWVRLATWAISEPGPSQGSWGRPWALSC